MNVVVWNSNTLSFDDFIGSGKVLLHKALAEGYDDSAWVLQTKTGRHAGEVRLIIHYRNARLTGSNYAPSASPYAAPPVLQASMYSMPSLASVSSYPPPASTCYPQPSTAYPSPSPSPYSVYQPCAAGYPPSPYTAPQAGGYPPPYPTTSSYPPLPYPAPPPSSSYYPPPGPLPGMYPPPY